MYVVYLLIYSFIEFPYKVPSTLKHSQCEALDFCCWNVRGLGNLWNLRPMGMDDQPETVEFGGKSEFGGWQTWGYTGDIRGTWYRFTRTNWDSTRKFMGIRTMGIPSGYNGDTMEHTSNNMIIGFVEQWRIPETIAIWMGKSVVNLWIHWVIVNSCLTHDDTHYTPNLEPEYS